MCLAVSFYSDVPFCSFGYIYLVFPSYDLQFHFAASLLLQSRSFTVLFFYLIASPHLAVLMFHFYFGLLSCFTPLSRRLSPLPCFITAVFPTRLSGRSSLPSRCRLAGPQWPRGFTFHTITFHLLPSCTSTLANTSHSFMLHTVPRHAFTLACLAS